MADATLGRRPLDVARTVTQVQVYDQALDLVFTCLGSLREMQSNITAVSYNPISQTHPQFTDARHALQNLEAWLRQERDFLLGQLLNEGQLGLPLDRDVWPTETISEG